MNKENVVYVYNGIVQPQKVANLICDNRMALADIMLTETSQSQKDRY